MEVVLYKKVFVNGTFDVLHRGHLDLLNYAKSLGDYVVVGDSLGMTTLGYKTTIPVTMDDMLRSARAVSRGVKRAFTVGDMPYMSYQISNEEAIKKDDELEKLLGDSKWKYEEG